MALDDRLSRFTLELYHQAATADFTDFQDTAMAEVEKLIPFDGAIWSSAAMVDSVPQVYQAKLCYWPQEWLIEFEKVAHQDVCIKKAFANPGHTTFCSHRDVPRTSRELIEFGEKYNIGCAIGTVIFVPTAGLSNAVGLHRYRDSEPFSEVDRELKQMLTPHLVESMRQCRQAQIRRDLLADWNEVNCTAVCDERGILHDAEDRFIKLLLIEWPEWQGARLPAPLETLNKSKQEWHYRSEKIDIRCGQLAGMWLLIGKLPGPLASLTARELDIALRFAHGETFRAIALDLHLAPSTVRNHLSHIYSKLAVSNKSELQRIAIMEQAAQN